MTNVFSENDLEILIATKNRNNLDFLAHMFPFEPFSNFNILIINQSKENVLISDFENVRVINVNEKGLSKSRNLAIINASKKICLIADDDVVYFPNFQNQIIAAFNQSPEASIITFNHQREGLDTSHNSSRITFSHSPKSIWNVCSIEIAFQIKDIKENTIYFDENFGLGSNFETAEEYLFLRDAIQLKLSALFCPLVIVSHPLVSSGENQGDDKIVLARAALFCKTKGNLAYIWLLKYVFFLVRKDYIEWNESVGKYKTGLSGIRKYKEQVKLYK
jgi:glycosyltransferase involved in cell wall biosynthesis